MRYLCCLFVLIGFTAVLRAQFVPRSTFGLELYPHQSNFRLQAAGSVTIDEIERLDSLEGPAFGYGIGFFYGQRQERIGFQFGLRYLNTGYEVQRGPLVRPVDGFTEFSATVRTQLLEVPFYLNFYQNMNEKTSVTFHLGIAAGIHLDTRIELTLYEGSRSSEATTFDDGVEYRRGRAAILAGIGYETQLAQRWRIGIHPNFEYWLSANNQVDEVNTITRNYYNYGLRLTLLRERY